MNGIEMDAPRVWFLSRVRRLIGYRWLSQHLLEIQHGNLTRRTKMTILTR